MKSYNICFWNLENLFDVDRSPRRTEKLQRAIGKAVKGWTQTLLNTKIKQLASIITQMNNGQGPDILGVCEVENAFVLQSLIEKLEPLGRNYALVHHHTQDRRGIDVAFIYDADLFTPDAVFDHVVMRRTATRDIVQVNFRTQFNRLLVVIGNHWPSRSGGRYESEGYRAIAGETMAYFHQRIFEEHGKDTPVIAMGDFNDEPFDRSLLQYANTRRTKVKTVSSRSATFLNLMWELMGEGTGSFYFNNAPNMLDQFLVNENMLKRGCPIKVDLDSVEILKFPEMIKKGKYPMPVHFGGMGKTVNKKGFSDHFPISVIVEEKELPE